MGETRQLVGIRLHSDGCRAAAPGQHCDDGMAAFVHDRDDVTAESPDRWYQHPYRSGSTGQSGRLQRQWRVACCHAVPDSERHIHVSQAR